jgi:hypothetical protein
MPPDERRTTWADIARVVGGALLIYLLCAVAVFFSDPYGRSGFTTSATVPNVSERYWIVSRAMDQSFDSAIVGNSTSIPMQPEVLDRLTGLRFVSLSISGSGAPVALQMARFFLRQHEEATTLIVALDDSWCRSAAGMAEGRPFPFWLYGDGLDYAAGLFSNVSIDMLKEAFWLEKRNGFRTDGYHPYSSTFEIHGFNDLEMVRKRLDQNPRPTGDDMSPPYQFDPPLLLERLISTVPPSINFVLFWTPRYVSLLPMPGTAAEVADAACKQQVEVIAQRHRNVRIVNWSGPDRSDNFDPANFYEPNHYRDVLAIKMENEIAASLNVLGGH